MKAIQQFFPILTWIKGYNKGDFAGDLSAGLTVGVMLIPQGMAYSMLAGLPPIYGLYASTIPLIVYALLGTSRQLAVGPVAMVALLISSGVGAIAELGSAEFISLAIVLALMVGAIQFLMGALRLGFLVNFLSHPVISGFTSAAALIIGFSQLKHLFGIDIPRGKVHETIMNVVENFDAINWTTLIVGLIAIVMLIVAKRIHKRIPGPLIVVIVSMLAVYFMKLYEGGVKIVKDIPEGLPTFGIPTISMESINILLPTALTIALIGFMESIAVAKAIQAKHKTYNVVPNQELIGLGLSNILGSFFKAFPVTGGFSRTAVNDQAGAKTGMSSIISAVLIIITLLFLTDYFYYLPKAVLSAIIMVAVYGLIDFKEARNLWRTDKRDFTLFMVTAIGTLILGIEEGIIIGVILSAFMVIYKISYPHMAELGRIPGTSQFRNINRFEQLEQIEDTVIFRFDAQLYFANTNYFRDLIYKRLREQESIRNVIIHAGAISSIDSSAIHMLHDLIEDLNRNQISLFFVEATGPVRDTLAKNGIDKLLGPDKFHLSVADAQNYIRTGSLINQDIYTLQNDNNS